MVFKFMDDIGWMQTYVKKRDFQNMRTIQEIIPFSMNSWCNGFLIFLQKYS